MIFKILAVPCFGLLASLAFAQETAHLIGPISDGTPVAPAPPMPKLDIAPEDVLETTVRDLGNRKITIQKVTPIELPPLPEPATPVELTDEQRAALAARREEAKKTVLLMMSVTVLHSVSYPGGVRTQFRWWPKDKPEGCEVFSSIDGNLLSGFADFESGDTRYSLLLGVGNQDLDRWAAAIARKGGTYAAPQIPTIPEEPGFVVTKGSPTPEELAPIVAIHALVKNDGEKLRLAYEGRVRAQQEQEAFLKANPPKPQDIVLRYWRVPKPAAPDASNGGDR